MHPLVYGDYPALVRRRVGARLPVITTDQSKKLSGSFDFIGFNHYLVMHTQEDKSAFNRKQRDYYADAAAIVGK
jgi:beta-glucosidase